MALNNQSLRLADLGRHDDALAAVTEAVERVLPVLERGWYALPDGGLSLAQAYIQRCSDLDREPDEDLMVRFFGVLRAAGYEFDDEGE